MTERQAALDKKHEEIDLLRKEVSNDAEKQREEM